MIPFLLASPAAAWEFTPAPICTLTHMEPGVDVVLTFDQSIPEYTIAITAAAWPDADRFQMQFIGQRYLSILTDRHELSADQRRISVADVGFGNVLNGLQFNDRVIASSGGIDVTFNLAPAAPAVAAFRDCPAAATS